MMEQRETLLRKWAELAPGECAVLVTDGDGQALRYALGRKRSVGAKYPDGECADALLSALIEAICARGKHYVLESYVADEGTRAKATMILEYGNRHARRRGYAAEPCDALLSAYIQALEVLRQRRVANERH